jgi:hypothetical protein
VIRIIGFAGPAGSGKDTCGAYFVERGWTRISFADPLKRGLKAMGFGDPQMQWEKEKLVPGLPVTWRHCAQTLGTEWGRQLIDPDLWVILAQRYMATAPAAKFVFTDVRFENEAKMIREAHGVIVHLEGRGTGTSNDAHQSEQRLKNHLWDLNCNNSGSLSSLHDWLADLHRYVGV